MARQVHVLGGGALGTLWAVHLAESGIPTTLLLRNATPAARTRRLLGRVTCGWESRVSPMVEMAAEPSSGPGEAISTLVLATKAYSAAGALEGVLPRLAPDAVIVLMCNGALSVAETLQRSGLQPSLIVLAATTTHGAWLKPVEASTPICEHHVVHAGNGQTWVGPLLSGKNSSLVDSVLTKDYVERAHQAALSFGAAGLGAIVEDSAKTQQRLWLKLAANSVLNPLTALWNVRNGEVLARTDGRAIADAVCAEIAELAALLAPSVALSHTELRDFVTSCAAANAQNWSSMQQDMAAGRRTEVEELNGWVVSRCKQLDVACNANSSLVRSIQERSLMRGQ
mmetsp:Transcript_31611/g.96751  ORF Transcript_31611/g.96751 Transcript_31611/m.96751 type:complete len:340 (-) Transcript_31611:153-1172(-)